jgi:DNA-binding NarL/FixJ family response regulator
MPTVAGTRLVGRRKERALLDELIARSRSGSGQTAIVSGEAGVGKSRLLGEVMAGARDSGHRVLVGGCVGLRDGAAPLAPVAEALRGLAAETSRSELELLLGPAREAVSGLIPALAVSAGSQMQPGLMHLSTQDRLHTYLVDFIARLSLESPVVLVVEDIHWADTETLELLSLLARNLRNSPFALIVSYRSDEADEDGRITRFLAELERSAHPRDVSLQRLTRGEARELVGQIRGVEGLPDLVNELFARSLGNPFYIEELLATDLDGAVLPGTLQAVLEARLGSLSREALQLVSATAVRGSESTEAELQDVTGIQDDQMAAGLHELLDRKIFERRRVAGREVVYFRHALLREAAYQRLLSHERQRLHRAFAAMVRAQRDLDRDPYALAELARHLEAAGSLDDARSASLLAAQAAEAAFQPALANDEYERALRISAQLGAEASGSADRLELIERAARTAAAIGSPRAVELIEQGLEYPEAQADPVRAGLLYERLGRYRWYAADGEGSLVAYREAVRLVPVRPYTPARARVCAGLGQLLNILARFEESARFCDEALTNARAVDDRVTEGHATNTMGVNTAYLGDLERGLELLWAAKAIAEEVGSVEDVGRAYANLVDVLLTGGRYEEAAALGISSFDYQVSHGLVSVYGGGVLTYAAWALHILARWPEAQATLDKLRYYALDTNSEIFLAAISAMVEACLGELDRAEAHLALGRPLIAQAIDTQLILPFAEAEAELAVADGRPVDALRAVMDGIERAEPLVGGNIKRYGPVYALGLRAAADIVAGQGADQFESESDEARAQASLLMSQMRAAHRSIRTSHQAHLRLAEPYLALCRAEMTRVEAKADPSVWQKAAAGLSTLGRRYLVAYSLWRQAEAELLKTGRGAAVGASLGEAHEIATAIGAAPLSRQIESLARRAKVSLAGGDRIDATRDARFGLTARETEVLRRVAAGKTNREIGAELFISDKTASVHVSHVLSKLGVERRAEAASMAARLGLVETEDGPSS